MHAGQQAATCTGVQRWLCEELLAGTPVSSLLLLHRNSGCRLSLSEGHFQAPLTARAEAVNACALSSACSLLACAGEGGLLEGFDPRTAQPVGCLDAAAAMGVVSSLLWARTWPACGKT